jgi:hypothetical protein
MHNNVLHVKHTFESFIKCLYISIFALDDVMDDENICSVCWDTFKFPKLLPCKHTFCLSCLHEFLEGLEDKSAKIEIYRHLMKDSTYKIQGNINVLVDIGCRTNRKRVSVFGFTRPGLKPTIYRTRGEHSNHYATDAVRQHAKLNISTQLSALV